MPDEVKLNANLFFARIKTVVDAWNVCPTHASLLNRPLTAALQNAGSSPELESMTGVDALLVVIGDPAGDDEPDRKSTAFQVRSWTRL